VVYRSRLMARPWFFFSSRRRHTRSYGDWSSDVCSSDLPPAQGHKPAIDFERIVEPLKQQGNQEGRKASHFLKEVTLRREYLLRRSEERRVGKECRSRWWGD